MPTTVLLIDDDTDTRATLRLVLEDAGYRVIEAAAGEAALGVLRTSPSGLVVLFDDGLPRVNGDGLLAVLAREGWLTACHTFVYMTTNPQDVPASLAYALAHFQAPLVAKPFDVDDLLAAIRQAEQRLALLPVLPAPERRSGGWRSRSRSEASR